MFDCTFDQSDDILKCFSWKKVAFCDFLETNVHKRERRESDSCSNDTNDNALEKRGLGASFEPQDGSSSRLATLQSLIKMILFVIFSAVHQRGGL